MLKWRSVRKAWVKERCSYERCTSHAMNRSVCMRHGAQSANDAAKKDVQIWSSKEVCASGMGQRDYAKAKDAQIRLRKEGCALDMGNRVRHLVISPL